MWPIEAIVLVSLGLLPIGIGVWEIRMLWSLHHSGVRCTGTVVDLERRFKGGSGLTFAPVVEFVDDRGQPRRFTSHLASGPAMYEVGDQVPVTYLPGRADKARLTSVRHTLTTLLTAFVVGAVFVAIGLAQTHSAEVP
ncbi:DUF3592 domain-containing protein [Kineosporia sp. J2-2]|uniref:DUF3592 domain-containing protein n=1 Tax=Kineosporia corallincola TaxID=2835133 RepID=A0ABS5TCN2_9ACTN|nr:DUF3592 domain-containing protein [Kineosporia corallincola]MBT0768608.1 DUF3592 domain-containing protein [Kineosporia corallincola]